MASFPEDLPPADVDPLYKFIIYFVILYVLTTAITTWLITRKRSFPSSEKQDVQITSSRSRSSVALGFENRRDHISSLAVQKAAADAALSKLDEIQEIGDLSSGAYDQLHNQYTTEISVIEGKMQSIVEAGVDEDEDEGVSQGEMEEIEAELEQQLMDLEEDEDFLTRPKKKMEDIFEDQTPPSPAPSQPRPTPQAKQPTIPKPPPAEKKAPPQPSPPVQEQPPAPAKEKAPSSSAPPPPSTSKSATPPPPPRTQPKRDQPPSPSEEPLTAAQPVKVKSDEEEGVFAKSTSIAALRMDMLRELARLKKLIPEDQQDQD